MQLRRRYVGTEYHPMIPGINKMDQLVELLLAPMSGQPGYGSIDWIGDDWLNLGRRAETFLENILTRLRIWLRRVGRPVNRSLGLTMSVLGKRKRH